jgi:probable phosphoglycerate mutase
MRHRILTTGCRAAGVAYPDARVWHLMMSGTPPSWPEVGLNAAWRSPAAGVVGSVSGEGMLLHCIRHGITASNLAHRFNDSEDEPLLPEEAAALRGALFPTDGYDRVHISPFRRCVETAAALGIRGGVLEPRLGERRLGHFQGLTSVACAALHAESFAAFRRFDADYVIPGGESRAQHLARVLEWLEETYRTASDRVLAVTHGGVIDFLYRIGTGHSLHGGARIFAGDNSSLSSFDVAWPSIELLEFSRPLTSRASDSNTRASRETK